MNNLNLATALTAAIALGTPILAGEFDPMEPVAMPSAQLEYFNLNPAIQMADAYGELTKGGHGTFGKFPANFDSGLHTHTGAYHGVVLKGVMTNPFEGDENPAEMGAGSYWYVPAKMQHSTLCISDEPCEFFFFADGAFDFIPVK